MADFREQRAAVKFCFLLGKIGTETLEILKAAYKDDAMGKTQVFEWFSRLKNGEMSIDDKPRSDRPSTAQSGDWFFHHDNAPAHTALSVRQFLTKNGMTPCSKEKTTEALSSISKDEFRQCFEKWNKRLDKCISVSGEYFEGD
ncbi:hypothetical protein B7P43_G03068 [Cryptotermes secundus]|uniref:Mos1 transposase HTH domain-containing protein n=1 Tax=Cryptotermes secundus TaxID=105785 RepID=A0A2J7Q7P9_9NEOP|nr:hypothetical protein B7P43_G03068 [Cryptotermes secundus]